VAKITPEEIERVIVGGGLLADSRADLNIGRISEAWWPHTCKWWKRLMTDDFWSAASVSSKPVGDAFKHTGDQSTKQEHSWRMGRVRRNVCIDKDSAFSNSLVPSVPFDLILIVRSRKSTDFPRSVDFQVRLR
jgi:hypothetical protein